MIYSEMSDFVIDESRRQFEEWAGHRYGKDELQIKPDEDELGEYSDEYENHLVQGEWEAWQASRQAQPTVAYLSCHGDALTPDDFAGGAEEMHETAKREGWRPLSIKGGE